MFIIKIRILSLFFFQLNEKVRLRNKHRNEKKMEKKKKNTCSKFFGIGICSSPSYLDVLVRKW